jgi:pyridoxine/pyridoxamine 5'-phosphate oxidase
MTRKNPSIEISDSYKNISDTLVTADEILSDAVDNAKTLFHTLTLSSIDGHKVASRVVVLREFNLEKRFLRFHTDYRAAKINQYKDNNNASVLGYDPELKVQIKLQGTLEVHYDDEITQSAWHGSTARSQKCYSVKGGSTKEIDNPVAYDIDEENMEDGYVNFSVLIFRFTSLEFLYLKSSGHRRAIHSWDEDYSCTWLVP